MAVPDSMMVNINYEDSAIPASARKFRPAVYRDGEAFCVLLGEDPQAGIFGCGDSTQNAFRDWDEHFKQRLGNHEPGDELVQLIEAQRDNGQINTG